jgi:hypothetical protein
LREHIANGKITPADRNALLEFTSGSKYPPYAYLIPATEMKMSHLELFQCWTRCKDIHKDSDLHVPEYLAYLEFDVHDFLLDKWLQYRDDKDIVDVDENTRLYRIRKDWK